MKTLIHLNHALYRIGRPVLFLADCEAVHTRMTRIGGWIGAHPTLNNILQGLWRVQDAALEQRLAGIHFQNPIGLAAGFDYEAKLPLVLPSLGFGFGSVGTITNEPYEGNPKPRLSRLVKSRSLLVNKGFKNEGIDSLIAQHQRSLFSIPIGLSIGKTNRPMDQNAALADIVSAFKKAETGRLPFSYYELNISCPNLVGNVDFYSPNPLAALLKAVTNLALSKPLFIKMPISVSNAEIEQMLDTICQFKVEGVILGNLQKDRTVSSLNSQEVEQCGKGGFSGKSTWDRSNSLIELAYRRAGKQLIIIGCGGVFSAADAYRKIRLGASLVQLITGLIYEGPQLPAQINAGLLKLLRKDGFNTLEEAIGADVRYN